MPLDIDGFAVLAAIARAPDVFAAARQDVAKTAKVFVARQLKDKGLTAAGLVAINTAIGEEAFDLIADGLSESEIKAVATRVDKLNGTLKTAAPQELRAHLAALARGTAAPAEKTVKAKAPKATLPVKPKVERSGNVTAMRARRKV